METKEMTIKRTPETAPAVISQGGQALYSRPTPKAVIAFMTEVANVLAPIIMSQNMYSMIQGKKYPKVESWLTLGAIVGTAPREGQVTELEDGSYVAYVELINAETGIVVGGASALCGIEEKRWRDADKYARRSMAITRATGKAFRLKYSWVMQLAGLEVTPAEEMPGDVVDVSSKSAPTASAEEKHKAPPKVFDSKNRAHTDKLITLLEKRDVPDEYWDAIALHLEGAHLENGGLKKTDLEAAIKAGVK